MKNAVQISGRGTNGAKGLIIGLVAAMLIVLPVIALIASFQHENGENVTYQDETGLPTGDMSMDESSRSAWEAYLDSTPAMDPFTLDVEGAVSSVTPVPIDSLPDWNASDVEYRENSKTDGSDEGYSEIPRAGAEESNDQELDSETSGGSSSEKRELEESDIVKAQGERLYVLNQYRGLIIVNLEDTSDPFIEGSIQLLGHPVSMYIVDFLGFVIASGVPASDGSYMYSGMLYIIDLRDSSSPRLIRTVEIPGYPVDSRRVGEVIYVISNEQRDYWYYDGPMLLRGGGVMMEDAVVEEKGQAPDEESDGPTTHIISVGFYDPDEIGFRDEVELDGNAGMVYASSMAIYIPQPNYDYANPETRFTYVDISDPEGDIRVRGSITLPGLLFDRYQMDHYKGMFRAVTQVWPSGEVWRELPMSTLFVVDARDPDHLKKISSLVIDDSGNLMATRFAAERAYTIHLPRSLDPLDVVDLSDPEKPELTDVLELPGWVEHMEVIGYDILAIGVEDQAEDGWKVTLSLFDVSDPYNAVLDDRVLIGEGYTYSSANYDPKALTVLEEQEFVLIPFSSYDWNGYRGSSYGVQIVGFDLEAGKLEKEGVIPSDEPVERTRWVNGAVVTMSQISVQTVDVSSPDAPVVKGRVELTSNVADAFISGGKIVSLHSSSWYNTGVGIGISDPASPDRYIMELSPEEMEYTSIKRKGTDVYITGIVQGDGEAPRKDVYRYDLSDPASPVIYPKASIPVPDRYTDRVYLPDDGNGKVVYDEEEVSGDDGDVRNGSEPVSGSYDRRIWYDPFVTAVLDDGSVLLYLYDYMGSGNVNFSLYMVSWNGTNDPLIVKGSVIGADYVNVLGGNSGRVALVSTNWWPPSSELLILSVDSDGVQTEGRYQVTGRIFGISEGLDMLYTEATFEENGTVHYTLNIYGLDDGTVLIHSIDLGVPLSDVRFNGDSIVVVSYGWDMWHTYDKTYVDTDEGTAYGSVDGEGADEAAVKEGSESSTSGPDETRPGVELIMIALDEGLFGSISRMDLEETSYLSCMGDDILVMRYGMANIVIGISDSEPSILGTWLLNGWVSGGDLDGDTLVLAMGLWGLSVRTV